MRSSCLEGRSARVSVERSAATWRRTVDVRCPVEIDTTFLGAFADRVSPLSVQPCASEIRSSAMARPDLCRSADVGGLYLRDDRSARAHSSASQDRPPTHDSNQFFDFSFITGGNT